MFQLVRHPEIFLKAERKAWFPGMGLYRVLFGRFSFGSKYAELGDDELNRIVRNLKFALLGFPVIIIAVVGITLASQTN